jgi:hypothetical protein
VHVAPHPPGLSKEEYHPILSLPTGNGLEEVNCLHWRFAYQETFEAVKRFVRLETGVLTVVKKKYP